MPPFLDAVDFMQGVEPTVDSDSVFAMDSPFDGLTHVAAHHCRSVHGDGELGRPARS